MFWSNCLQKLNHYYYPFSSDKCWVKNTVINIDILSYLLASTYHLIYLLSVLLPCSASLQPGCVCHVLHGPWIREWKWQGGTATVPKGRDVLLAQQWARVKQSYMKASDQTHHDRGDSASTQPWWRLDTQSGPSRSHVYTAICSEEEPPGSEICRDFRSIHEKTELCKTGLTLQFSQQVPWVWPWATAQ